MAKQQTIFVGSLWHQGCDTFARVTGFEQQSVLEAMHELMKDEEREWGEEGFEADIMTGGVFQEPFSFAEHELDDEHLVGLEANGITVD